MNKIICLKDINYFCNNKLIISNISLNIYQDKITALRGPNGAGKTTLLKLMHGLLEPSSGYIFRNYTNISRASMIFQNPIFLNSSVYSNLEHALFCINIDKNKRKGIITSLLNKYSLQYLSDKDIRLLSGGELQLVSLLRSLVIQPKIIFYDEPTNNLDRYNTDFIKDIIKSMVDEKKQIILVSHDDKFVSELDCCNIYLKEGSIEE